MRPYLLALAVFVLGATVAAQSCTSLSTTFASNNGQSGNMFDVQAVQSVILESVSINVDAGSWDVEVHAVTGGGTIIGVEEQASSWTLLGTATGVSGNPNTPTSVPLSFGVAVNPGQIQGLYVTVINGAAIKYTNGTAVGSVAASDANLVIFEGTGNVYPFGGTFRPRIWNGSLTYAVPGVAAPFETNDPESSVAIAGVETIGCASAALVACPGNPVGIDFDSVHAGLGYEVAVVAALPVPAAMATSGGQLVNIPLAHPSLGFLNGGVLPSFSTPFPGAFAIGFPAPFVGFEVALQMVNVSPSHPDGFAFSQAPGVIVTVATSRPGPEGDEEIQVFSAQPLCGPAAFPFYGTAYSEFWVSTNGRVGFGPPTMDFTASPEEARTGPPFVGFWTDLDATVGIISVVATGPSFVRVAFAGVPYHGEAASVSLFVELHADGDLRLAGLTGIASNPVSTPFAASADRQFLGLSAGGAGAATDAGTTLFSPGTSGTALTSSDMIYDYWDAPAQGVVSALVPSLATGLSLLVLSPQPSGGYSWSAF